MPSNELTLEQQKALYSKARKKQQESYDSNLISGQYDSTEFEGFSFDVHKSILENIILGKGEDIQSKKFVNEQARLHSLNPLTAKFFNPVGFAMNFVDDDLVGNPTIQTLLTQLASDVVGGGAFETSDGKTFTRVLDNDYESTIFKSAEEFKNDVGEVKSPFNSMARSLLERAKQAIGVQSPTRSILGQVIAYSNDKLKVTGSQVSFPDDDNVERHTLTGVTEVNGLEGDSLRYLYSEDKLLQNPLEYVRLRQKVKDGFFASNMYVRKHPDILELENKNSGGDKKRIIQNFLRTGLIKMDKPPDPFYQNWKFNFSKDYPSPYEMFFINQERTNDSGEDLSGETIEEKFNNFYESFIDSLVGIDSKWTEDEKERIKDTSPVNITENKIFPKYDISTKYTLKQIRSEVGDIKDPVALQRFINTKSRSGEIITRDDIILGSGLLHIDDDAVQIDKIKAKKHYLSFEDVRTNKVIFLRPSIDSITTDIQPSFEEEQFLGRTESLYSYSRTTNTKSLTFKLHSNTPMEHIMNLKKLNFMKSLAYPIANDDFSVMKTPIIRLSVTKFFNNIGGVLNSVSIIINNEEASWEEDEEYISPRIIDVNISMTVLHDVMPSFSEGEDFSDITQFPKVHNTNYSEFLDKLDI